MLGTVLICCILFSCIIGVLAQVHKINVLNNFAQEMVSKASEVGKCTGVEIEKRYLELVDTTGIKPNYIFIADYYNSAKKLVQYGEPITVELSFDSKLIGFGNYYIPQTLTTKSTEQSMQYWK